MVIIKITNRVRNKKLIMPSENTPKPITMRNHWFAHVAKTRKKLTRSRKVKVTHREAMREASLSWAVEKEKIVRKNARLAKRKLREKQISPKNTR